MTAFPVENFGGLRLDLDPSDLGLDGAIDLLNVDLFREGRVRQRDGYQKFTVAEGTNRYTGLHEYSYPSYLVAEAGSRIEVMNFAGTVLASLASADSAPHDFVNYGTPTSQQVFIASSEVPSATVRRLDSTTFSVPTYTGVTPVGRKLAVTPWDNRLVNAQSVVNPSRVWFSDPGDPLTFGTNNYIDLTPGDGQPINKLIAWRDLLFAFKSTKFFVFYGTSVDGAGEPIFEYRSVNTGVGGYTAVAGKDAVYFTTLDGIYKTTGGPPTEISQAIRPLFTLEPELNGFTNLTRMSPGALAYGRDLLVCAASAVPSGAQTLLVLDLTKDTWTAWDISASALLFSTKFSTRPELLFDYYTGLKHIGLYRFRSDGPTTDDGTAISSRYQSGFSTLGSDSEKVLQEVKIWGTGTVAASMATDLGSLGSATNVTLGTSPAIAEGRYAVANQGTLFSYKLASVSGGAWSVSRVVPLADSEADETTRTT